MVIDEGKEVNKELTLKIQLSVCIFVSHEPLLGSLS